jgi:hypothetical protein
MKNSVADPIIITASPSRAIVTMTAIKGVAELLPACAGTGA